MNKLTLYNVKLHGITFLLIFLFSITSYSMSCIEFFNAKGKSRISKKVTSYSYEKVKQEGLFFKTPTVLTSIRSELDKAAFRKMAKQEFDKRGFLGTEKVEYIAEIIDGRVSITKNTYKSNTDYIENPVDVGGGLYLINRTINPSGPKLDPFNSGNTKIFPDKVDAVTIAPFPNKEGLFISGNLDGSHLTVYDYKSNVSIPLRTEKASAFETSKNKSDHKLQLLSDLFEAKNKTPTDKSKFNRLNFFSSNYGNIRQRYNIDGEKMSPQNIYDLLNESIVSIVVTSDSKIFFRTGDGTENVLGFRF